MEISRENFRKKGYKAGRVIERNKLILGIGGGGICNLANTINLLVIHSPLLITEFHTHSDALAPDETVESSQCWDIQAIIILIIGLRIQQIRVFN